MIPPPLVALSPGNLEAGDVDAFVVRVAAALEGGLRGVLFRETRLDDFAWGNAFARLRELTAPVVGAWLGAHDRVHLALAGEADGVHLGFRSLPPDRVRAMAPDTMAVGLSTHADDDRAEWAAADYLFHGPVHATPSKEGLQDPIGPAGLARAVTATSLPVLGIGGLHPEHVADVLAIGAHGVAVLSGVLGAPDPADAARAYLSALSAGGAS